MTMHTIWVVDDDRAVRFVLAQALRDAGHAVREFADAASVLQALDQHPPPALLFTDVRMPGDDGLTLLRAVKARHPDLPVVMVSAYTDVASTAGAFRGGAHDFLSKPFDVDAAAAMAARILQASADASGGTAAETVDIAPQPAALLGNSAPMQALFRAIGRVAVAPVSVLITGETGVGKELVAQALHRESSRASGPFIALNTAAIPAELLESELFGHEAGAFTGAQRRHIGRFEQADGGTLFLDEIGDMPLSLQTRLLRVLADGTFYRVGGRELIRADVRILAATHQPLEARVDEGRFRADLLHRLDVVRLAVPPLRQRRTDIPLLATQFLQEAGRATPGRSRRFTRAALEDLQAHDWPGNVRELQNVCWRLATLAPGASIQPADVQAVLGMASGSAASADWETALGDWARERLQAGNQYLHAQARERFDRVLLQAAIEHHHGHRGKAAEALGLGRNAVTRKLGRRRKAGSAADAPD